MIKNIKAFTKNMEEYKRQYDGVTASYFNRKPLLEHKRKWKNAVYSIKCRKCEEYKLNIIWLYLNGDVCYGEAKRILERKI